MKKNNNKYRNNNYSNIYSLNYKFDSCSIAGKISGTALDLIKKYNELAKEAQSNGDHVNAEVFRQYAEHYRKIVTDINEKKMQNIALRNQQIRSDENNLTLIENPDFSNDASEEVEEDVVLEQVKAPVIDINAELTAEPSVFSIDGVHLSEPKEEVSVSSQPEKKSFTVIEIKPESAKADIITAKDEQKPRTRKYVRKKTEKALAV